MAVPLNKNAVKNGPNGWWFHGKIDEPPAAGEIAELPAGGKWYTQVSCDKHFTTWGNPNERYGEEHYACDSYAMLHSGTGQPGDGKTVQHDIKGCALAIAYESDPHKVDSNSMVIFSVNYQCPWFKEVEFEIPADLPPCPPGGCHCSWNWSHSPAGGGSEFFMTLFKCNIKGATGNRALPPPKVANKCPWDRNNCTVGAKTPFIFNQAEGNNIWQDFTDPPYYNWEYGFANGAQTDLWEKDVSVTNTEWAPNPWESYAAGKHPAVTPAANRFVPPVQDGVTLVSPTWRTGPKTYPPGEDPSDAGNAPQPARTSVSLQPAFTTSAEAAAPTIAPSGLAAKPNGDAGAASSSASSSSNAAPTTAATPTTAAPTTGSGEAVGTSSAPSSSGSGEAVPTTAAPSSTTTGSGEAVAATTSAPSSSGTAIASSYTTSLPDSSSTESSSASTTYTVASDSGTPTGSSSGTAAVTGTSSGSGTAVAATTSGSGTAAGTAAASNSGTAVAATASGSGSVTPAPTANGASATAAPVSPSSRPGKCRPKKQRKRRSSF